MSKEGGEDMIGTAPLTRADILELVKAVADALTKRDDTPEDLDLQPEVPSLEVSVVPHMQISYHRFIN